MTANLAILDEIDVSIAGGTADRRGEILRRTVDLFIVGAPRYSDEEIALFDDVLMRLAAQIETSARALLAVRLAPISNAPPNIIRDLAFDDVIDVAGPVLRRSERLDDPTLVKNAQQKSQEHLLAISRRKSLSEAVTEVLVDRGDQQVVLSTARNRGARFSDTGFSKLVQRSEGDDVLSECVGSRPEVPPHLFLILLNKASKSVRAKLEATHPHAKREVGQAVAEVTDRIREETAGAPSCAAAQAAVKELHKAGRLNGEQIGAFAQARKFEETTAALALQCELPFEFVLRAMSEDRSETILVLARAAGLIWPAAKAVLELRAIRRPIAPNEMSQCMASYERLNPKTSRDIVRFYRMRAPDGTIIRPV